MRERKPTRMRNYDYSQDGLYFITTVTKHRHHWFGVVKDGVMFLNEYGGIVQRCWYDLVNHYTNCFLDEMVIMPNHLHGIIRIENAVGIKKSHCLSEFIRALKTFSSRGINEISTDQFAWQRSFHDRIIRDEKSYLNIKHYIVNNPRNWGTIRGGFKTRP